MKRAKRLLQYFLITVFCLVPFFNYEVEAQTGPVYYQGYRDMTWPVPQYHNISSCFYDERNHLAIDIATGGTYANVVSSYGGVVANTIVSDSGYGNQIYIQHSYTTRDGITRTIYTHYSHLSSIGVSIGQTVSAGQYIGKTGDTGEAYGIHLDFQILNSLNTKDSSDPYSNEMLQLPSDIYRGGTTSCCDVYISEIKAIYSNPIVQANNPFGYLDVAISTQPGKVYVEGWAADLDNPNASIGVHIYAVQNDTRIALGATTANLSRTDLINSYPGLGENHGFAATFNTGLSGDVSIEAYGINIGETGTNTMLTNSGRVVNVAEDTIAPTISKYEVTNISKTGYTVTIETSDNVAIKSATFPTWTIDNGQDDLLWHDGQINGNQIKCNIKISDHNNEVNCKYKTDIYIYDLAGNCTSLVNEIVIYIDASKPLISDVKVENVTNEGYTVKCKVADDSKINRVQFPTWIGENPYANDGSWHTNSSLSGKFENGEYVFKVNTSDYSNQFGTYNTHIYAWDEYGNQSECYPLEIEVPKKGETGVWKSNSTGWWYEYSDGTYPKNEFKVIDGNTYYFDSRGYRVTKWKKINNNWYYFDSSGVMVTNQWVGNYYLLENGVMATNQWIGNYYVGSDGLWNPNTPVYKWIKYEDKWKYLNTKTNIYSIGKWEKINNIWYYFDNEGFMVTGFQSIDGKLYYFESSGAMKTGWKKIDGYWYYFSSGGNAAVSGWKKIDGYWYYFKNDGKMAADEILTDESGVTYKFDENGHYKKIS